MSENEDADPVGAPAQPDPVALATSAAIQLNIIKEGDKLDRMLVDLWLSHHTLAQRFDGISRRWPPAD